MKGKKNILILGSTGMLGSEVLKVFSQKSNYSISTNIRNKKHNFLLKKNKIQNVRYFKFDLNKNKVDILKKYLKSDTIIINCIGIIKPHINEKDNSSVTNAINVNSIFPYTLFKKFSSRNVIYQIATDCVFSGKKGNYTEDDKHDANDVYGKSKSLGEVVGKNFFNLRTSIIGKELNSNKSLYEWFMSQKNSSVINGFSNHLWNGVTTKAFAKVLISIIDNKIKLPSTIHIIPRDKISKYKMLELFRKYNGKEIILKRINAEIKINRTLKTIYPKILDEIWRQSEYGSPPKLKRLISEI